MVLQEIEVEKWLGREKLVEGTAIISLQEQRAESLLSKDFVGLGACRGDASQSLRYK